MHRIYLYTSTGSAPVIAARAALDAPTVRGLLHMLVSTVLASELSVVSPILCQGEGGHTATILEREVPYGTEHRKVLDSSMRENASSRRAISLTFAVPICGGSPTVGAYPAQSPRTRQTTHVTTVIVCCQSMPRLSVLGSMRRLGRCRPADRKCGQQERRQRAKIALGGES